MYEISIEIPEAQVLQC